MSRINMKEVTTSLGFNETYNIVNAIRNEASGYFRDYVPLANAENVAEVGAGIRMNQTLQNEFITSLVERIGLVILRNVSLNNPLKKFKKGSMPTGRTIEEIFVDIAEEHIYDPETAEQEVFKREIPDVKTLFHELNRKGFYKQSVQDESLKTAFVSWGNFEGFLGGIINAIYNSAEIGEYRYMRMLIDNYYAKGKFKVIPITNPTDSTQSANEFIKKARATSRKMTLPMGSRDFNALAVHTRSTMNDLHLFIDADLEAEVSVEVLAKAFNMDKAELMGNVTIVDGFASKGLKAVMVDKDFFMVYDKVLKMETIRNPQGLYWNYFYHVWQVMSASQFAPAVAFVESSEAKEVTDVILDPMVSSVKAGKEMKFNYFIRQTDDEEYEPEFAVEAIDGSLSSGTQINQDGVLTIDEAETSQLKVTATVTVPESSEGAGDDYEVVGESRVHVTPIS